jgi:hypothetical protein
VNGCAKAGVVALQPTGAAVYFLWSGRSGA